MEFGGCVKSLLRQWKSETPAIYLVIDSIHILDKDTNACGAGCVNHLHGRKIEGHVKVFSLSLGAPQA